MPMSRVPHCPSLSVVRPHLRTFLSGTLLSDTFLSGTFLACALVASAAAQTRAAAPAPAPEVPRDPLPAQAVGVEHTLRVIPEACAYLHGAFTGDPALPYRYGASRTSSTCQPRARLADPARTQPSVAAGWILNDVIRIPDAACPQRVAVVRVWRKPVASQGAVDATGHTRIYLQDAKRQAEQGRLATLPQYVAMLTMEGAACR